MVDLKGTHWAFGVIQNLGHGGSVGGAPMTVNATRCRSSGELELFISFVRVYRDEYIHYWKYYEPN